MRLPTFLASCLLTTAGYLAFFAALAYTPQLQLRAQGGEEAPFLRTKNSDITKLPALVAYYEFDGSAANLATDGAYPLEIKAPYSISGGKLHANGSYEDWYNNRPSAFYQRLDAQKGFTIGFAFRLNKEAEERRLSPFLSSRAAKLTYISTDWQRAA